MFKLQNLYMQNVSVMFCSGSVSRAGARGVSLERARLAPVAGYIYACWRGQLCNVLVFRFAAVSFARAAIYGILGNIFRSPVLNNVKHSGAHILFIDLEITRCHFISFSRVEQG